MAIYINGIKVAGNSFSPYQIAVANGYTGTESEFNAALSIIGEAAAKYEEIIEINENIQEIFNKTVNIKDLPSKTIANGTDLNNVLECGHYRSLVAANTSNILNKPVSTNMGFTLTIIQNYSNNYRTQIFMGRDNHIYLRTFKISDADKTSASFAPWVRFGGDFKGATSTDDGLSGLVPKPKKEDKNKVLRGDGQWVDVTTDIFHYGASAPTNTKLLWIDSDANNGVIKYYNPTTQSWTPVPVAWS